MSTIDNIPLPPAELQKPWPHRFEPARKLGSWIRSAFIEEEGPFVNEEHAHLRHAQLGILWTNARCTKKKRQVLGRAQLGEPSGSDEWKVGKREAQILGWFGSVPDFIITIDARWFTEASNPARCALLEHELYHCAQKTDEYGMPAFSKKTGKPKFAIRGHDVEAFSGVVRRYGAWSPQLAEMERAFEEGPTLGEAQVDGICGSCGRQVA